MVVTGRQTHGAMPWLGNDTVLASASVVTSLQSVVSRRMPITKEPSVLSVCIIEGGNRSNILPESVKLTGTIRTFDESHRNQMAFLLEQVASNAAAAHGACAKTTVERRYPRYNQSRCHRQTSLCLAGKRRNALFFG